MLLVHNRLWRKRAKHWCWWVISVYQRAGGGK